MSLKRVATADRDISPPPLKRQQSTPTAGPGVNGTTAPYTSHQDESKKVPGTATSKAVANFFTPASAKPVIVDKTTWKQMHGTVLVGKYDKPDLSAAVTLPRRIAAFDLDSTLITTQTGKKFASEAKDWRFWHPRQVQARLSKLAEQGYLLIIVSNQAGLALPQDGNGSTTAEQAKVKTFKTKVSSVLAALDLPVSLYAATQHDAFRKPRVGMWSVMLAEHGLEAADVDLEGSFFVGDAGGRTAGKGKQKDFSCSDRNFAENVGIRFFTPEEYFLDEAPRTFARDFEPKQYLAALQTRGPPAPYLKRNELDIVLFVGSPGAGKSTFYWTQLEPLGYQRVNQDILKTRDNCLKAATTHLQAGLSVAVDATNADIDTRRHWTALAARHKVPIRCALFTAPVRLAEHNNNVRAMSSLGKIHNPEERALVPKIAFSSFAKRYTPPTLGEGFQDITEVEFVFVGGEAERLEWGRHWS